MEVVEQKRIFDKIEYASKYIENQTNDWFQVKKELLSIMSPKERSLFSRRHKTSKKHFINDFEKKVIEFWFSLTKVNLQIDDSKLHTSEDERPPRYWGLMKYNKIRSEKAALASKEIK